MISYQTDGVEMPAIKKRETTEWIKAVAATYEKESVKLPISSARTRKSLK